MLSHQLSALASNPEEWSFADHVSHSNLVFEKLITAFKGHSGDDAVSSGAQGPSRKREQCGTAKACAACRANKIKCDESKPCKNCIR